MAATPQRPAADRCNPGLPQPQELPRQLLQRLEWQVLRRLDGRADGDHRTVLRGRGVDFADLRDYTWGDDIRHIDWNVTARTDSPMVRQYLEDRELTAWLLVDRTASMHFGPTRRPKELVLVEVATALAALLTRDGNRVAGMLWNNGIERVVPPGGGRNQVLRLSRELLRPPALVAPAPSGLGVLRTPGRRFRRGQPSQSGTGTDLSGLFRHAAKTINRRSLVVVLSDFIAETGWERPLGMLGHRHEVVAVRLVDRRETELPEAGLVVVEDAETGELLSVDTSDPELRRRFAAVAAERQAQVTAGLRRAGVDEHTITTEDDLARALARLTDLRRRRRR